MTTHGLLNLGRDNEPGSTDRLDHRILRIVKDHVPNTRVVIQFVEVNEGDDNDEKAAIRDVFPRWQLRLGGTREPVLLSPDWPKVEERVRWVPGSSVKHWSPLRSVGRVYLPHGEVIFACHLPAGANGQGDRPDWARGPLQQAWDKTRDVHLQLEKVEHRVGRHVTWMEDTNAYTNKVLGSLPRQQTVVHERTDWGRVRPADGYLAHFRALPPVHVGLDSHKFLRMQGNYAQERG